MNAKLIGTSAVLIAFIAGLVLGLAVQQPVQRSAPGSRGGRESMLVRELNLSPEQQAKLREIWSGALASGGPPPFDQMDELRRTREQAIQELLSPEQQARYNQINSDFELRMQQLHEKSHAAFREAEEKTKAILDDAQRVKYEELLEKRRHRKPGPGGGPRGHKGPG